jgi:hypothetical protein
VKKIYFFKRLSYFEYLRTLQLKLSMLQCKSIPVLRIRTIFDRIQSLTQINFRPTFTWKFFWWKYELKSIFMNQNVKQQRFLSIAFTHIENVEVVLFIKARIRVRPKKSGSDRIRVWNTACTLWSSFYVVNINNFAYNVFVPNFCNVWKQSIHPIQ